MEEQQIQQPFQPQQEQPAEQPPQEKPKKKFYKKRWLWFAFIIFIIFGLVWAVYDTVQASNKDKHVKLQEAAQRVSCLAQGGQWRGSRPGSIPIPGVVSGYCAETYNDGGKACTSNAQCQGTCLAYFDATAGTCTSTSDQGDVDCFKVHFPNGVRTPIIGCP